jgi:glyoxylase-like metal-dependent hydrolase (beta-lactamase superfamily II)
MTTTVTKIRLRLSNATLIQGERAILVDSGSPGESQAIQKALAQAGVAVSALSLLLHTHGHSDHAGSTAELRRLSGEAIVGDVLMGGLMGGTFQSGKPNLHYFAENPEQVRRSLDFLLAQPAHTLYVGHGGPLPAEAVRTQADRLGAQLDKLGSSGDNR